MSLKEPRRTAIWLGLAAGIQRLALWLVYRPIAYGDTGSYFRAAEVLRQGGLSGYDGTRVPGYPALVALLGGRPEAVFVGQLVLGWLTTMLLFDWGWRLTRRRWPALAIAAGYTLIPGPFLFEANLLTETLTAFLAVLSLWLLLVIQQARDEKRQFPLALALGSASGAAGLVRILFYPLTVFLIPFVWNAAGSGWRRRAGALVAFLVPSLGLLLGWVAWVNASYGFLSPTTMGGYNLVQHTGIFFEYLPDQDAAIRDTYLRFRDARLAERGDQTNTIWEAIPALTEASGLGFYDLSRELQRLSLQLIREHPDRYLRNVVEGWVNFWKAPVYWAPEQVRLPAAVPILRAWGLVGRALSVAANAAFLGASAWVVLRFRRFRDLLRDPAWLAPWGLVWVTSVLQTLADHGDNPRFLIPLQAVVILSLVILVDRGLSRRSPA